MKLLVLVDTLATGGKERRMIELLKGLIKTGGYEITLVSTTPGVEYSYLLEMPIKLIELQRSNNRDLTIFSKIYKIIKEVKPDVIHSWGSMSSLYVLPSLIFYRKAKFLNGIIADAPENLSITNKYYLRSRITFPFSDAIASNSKAGIKSYKAPIEKSFCVYNGMDFNRFVNLKPKQVVLDKLGLKDDEFIVGMIAAFEERKDQETLVRAAAKIQEQTDKVRILFLGEGQLKKPMEELADSLKVKNVLFLGRITDVEDHIQIFNAGVLATNNTVHGEGISNALIECMAMAKPVIGTKGGGTNELITDGKDGFLIEPKDPDLLAEKILYLFNNKTEAEEMGKNAQKMVMERFTVDRMTTDFIAIYNSLV